MVLAFRQSFENRSNDSDDSDDQFSCHYRLYQYQCRYTPYSKMAADKLFFCLHVN